MFCPQLLISQEDTVPMELVPVDQEERIQEQQDELCGQHQNRLERPQQQEITHKLSVWNGMFSDTGPDQPVDVDVSQNQGRR